MGPTMTDHTSQSDGGTFTIDRKHQPSRVPDASLKRLFDIVVASIALVLLAPLLIVIALIVRLQDGQKALYAQPRYGLDGTTFMCIKLRSMVPDAAERLQAVIDKCPEARREWETTRKISNDPRITPLGQFIRKTSIDELPQLINIIRGDMSIVGPRPIPTYERGKYGEGFQQYSKVRPGLTGLWQISGRSDTTYEERVKLDIEYVNTQSFWGDIAIILKTIPAVVFSRGAK